MKPTRGPPDTHCGVSTVCIHIITESVIIDVKNTYYFLL